MTSPKVLISRKLPEEVIAYLSEHCEVVRWSQDGFMPREQALAMLEDIDAVLTTSLNIDDEFLRHAPKLKIVSNISVGYNNFDTAAMKARGVYGTNTPSVLDDSVADVALALMLASARRVTELDQLVKQGGWQRGKLKEEDLFGLDVHHATVGIIGMGRIGEAIAQRTKFGFNMNVLYYNRNRKPDAEEKLGVQYRTLEELLRESDFVVMMTPLTSETTHMIRKEHFAMMKQSAFFINISRGQTIDEQALIEALQEGVIRGAGLDVYTQEPVDPNNPLLSMPNVVTLPHIGSATAKTRFDMAMTAARNVLTALQGQTPPDLVNELK
ncbi:2-hydroxyacid dehydrogenase [Paenibacillus thalictri]|uniref:D-glycerate dehydrogenase n=1 Tax=Paenibacillus thalictri TaxID=2527873 RepID=A0A4Q9DTQ7_9BACL|nr:D-glycerate dehydrogenase [Paenibacillus thalictri]TBL80326.1 D-glycerate dehydrogenase [Paenibacillus thalictri]